MDRINVYRASRQMPHQSGDDLEVAPASAATSQQSASLAGECQLDKGHSLTLQASEASVLRITRGRAWLTFNPTLSAPSARLGDHFLSRGESVSLVAGEAVVMESYGPAGSLSACYLWKAAAANSAVATFAFSGWRTGLLLPLQDLRLALGLTAGALGRLVRGLTAGGVAGTIGMVVNFATIFSLKETVKTEQGVLSSRNRLTPSSIAAVTEGLPSARSRRVRRPAQGLEPGP